MMHPPAHPTLAHEKRVDVLRLARTPNIGPVTFFQLLKRYGSVQNAIDALPQLTRKTPLIALSREEAEAEIENTEKFGAKLIMYGETHYPALLHMISDPPPIITVSGQANLWAEKPLIAMVGSRNASANGCQLAQKIARELGEAGVIAVSGLARGIDSYVHKGALPTGTIGVIAGGIDNIYPPENAKLFEAMRETGAIISEQPFGALPFAGSFPGRNRIIAGMCLGTLVVEASPKSGSLITARFATENNRELFAIPGSPLDARAKGCNQLIKQGAQLVEDANDILHSINQLSQHSLSEFPEPEFDFTPAEEPTNSTEARQIILDKLGISAVGVDELVEQCHIPTALVQSILLELELAGMLKRSAGNKVALAYINTQDA